MKLPLKLGEKSNPSITKVKKISVVKCPKRKQSKYQESS